MRKFIFSLTALFTGLFVLSACGSFGSAFKDGPEITTISGVLSEQSTGDTYQGTHLLADDSNTVVALRSLSLNLSKSNYLGNRVKVVGIENAEDGVFEVTGVSLEEVLVPKEFDARLVEYINTDLGFKLKHYDNWIHRDDGTEISFFAPAELGEESDIIKISQNPFDYSPTVSEDFDTDTGLQAYAKQELSLTGAFEDYVELVGLDRLEAIKRESKEGDEFYYHLYRNGFIYTVSFIGSDNFDPENLKIFNAMISSFRFIGMSGDSDEANVVSDEEEPVKKNLPEVSYKLTKFRSKPYSFSASYPASWYYSGSSSSANSLWKYSFSDEIDGTALVDLEVFSGNKSEGTPLLFDGKEIYITEGASNYSVLIYDGTYSFKFTGDNQYSDLILVMAVSISHSDE